MNNRIVVSKEEIGDCVHFARSILEKKSQSQRDFGRVDMMRREEDFLLDTAQGKIAEVAFAKFCKENFDVEFGIDFKIYGSPTVTDFGSDICIVRHEGKDYFLRNRIDCKAVKTNSQWLLIEKHKFGAGAYVLVRVALPYGEEKTGWQILTGAEELIAQVHGFAYHIDFISRENGEPINIFRSGDCLINPVTKEKMNVKMKAHESVGIPIQSLRTDRQDWFGLVKWTCQGRIQ